MVLDEGWDVMGLATQMQNLSGGNVKFQTIPVTSIDGTGDNGESIVTVNTKKVHGFFDDLLGSKEENQPEKTEEKKALTDYKPEDYTVSVSNASEIGGLAGRVSKLTTDYGYKKGKVGNSPQAGVSESQVNAKDENDPAARALAKQLGGLKVVEDPSLGDKELSVTLSGTYSTGVIDGSAELLKPDDPNVGTLTPGMKDLDGDGIPDGDSNSGTATDGSSNGKNSGDDSKVVAKRARLDWAKRTRSPSMPVATAHVRELTR